MTVLRFDRFFDFHDHVGLCPHLVGTVNDGGAHRGIILIGNCRSDTRACLNQDFVAAVHKCRDATRGH